MNRSQIKAGWRTLSCFDLALFVWIAAMPVVQGSGWSRDQWQAVWFCAGAVLLMSAAAFSPLRRSCDPRPAALLACVVLLAGLWWHRPEVALGPAQRYWHLMVMLASGLYLSCGALLIWLVASWGSSVWVPRLVAGLACLSVAWGGQGMLLTPSQSALLVALGIPLALSCWPLWAAIPMTLGMTWRLWTLGSWTAICAMIIGALVMCWVAGHRRWAGAIGMFLAGLVLVNRHVLLAHFSVRLETWPLTWKEWVSSFWIGHGPETGVLSPMVQTSWGFAYRHQDVLSALRDYGVFMLIPLAWGSAVLWRGASSFQRGILAIIGLVMSVQTQAAFPRMMAFVCVVLGWCLMRKTADA